MPWGGMRPWHWTSRDDKKLSEEGAGYYRNSRTVWNTHSWPENSAMSRLRAGVKWHRRESFIVRQVLGWWGQPVTTTNGPKPGWGCPCPIQQCAPQRSSSLPWSPSSRKAVGSSQLYAVSTGLMTKYTAAQQGWYQMVTGGPCLVITRVIRRPATWLGAHTLCSPQPNRCAEPVIYS